jgi:hypothetical protein
LSMMSIADLSHHNDVFDLWFSTFGNLEVVSGVLEDNHYMIAGSLNTSDTTGRTGCLRNHVSRYRFSYC